MLVSWRVAKWRSVEEFDGSKYQTMTTEWDPAIDAAV